MGETTGPGSPSDMVSVSKSPFPHPKLGLAKDKEHEIRGWGQFTLHAE